MPENVVLYRKYRPQAFEELIGQAHVVKTLQNAIAANAISHAYLFCGPRGSGKTTIARIFAKAINCQNRKKSEPCNECDSCLEIAAGKALDLVEIDAASHTGVDDVRALIEGIKFAPVKSKYKIFIVDECHQLSKAAANALLKTLEEPPGHVVFILATTEAHKMIPTIISRCQRFDFKRLQLPEIMKKMEFILKKERIKFEEPVLGLIALNARGSLRDAESLLDKCINFTAADGVMTLKEVADLLGIVEVGQIARLVDFLVERNVKGAIEYLHSMADNGADLQEFAKTLVFYLRQLLLLKIHSGFVDAQNSGFSPAEIERMNRQIAGLSQRELHRMLEACIEAEYKMKYAAVHQLPLELAIIDMAEKEL